MAIEPLCSRTSRLTSASTEETASWLLYLFYHRILGLEEEALVEFINLRLVEDLGLEIIEMTEQWTLQLADDIVYHIWLLCYLGPINLLLM